MIDTPAQPLSGRRLFRASLQSVSSAFGAQLLLLLSGPLVARLLGVENRGYLAALYTFGIIAAWLGTLGLPTACTYHISTHPEHARAVVRAAVRMFLVQAPLVTALLYVVLLVWEQGKSADIDAVLYPMLLFPSAVLAHAYALALLQGMQRFSAYNVLAVFPVALYAGGVLVLFVLDEGSLLAVVTVWVGGALLSAVVDVLVALAAVPRGSEPKLSLSRHLLRFGLRAHLGHASPVATLPVDQAAVGAFLSPAALGLYTVAAGFTNLLRLSAESIGTVAYPAMAVRGHTREAWRLLWRFFVVVTVFTAALSAMLIAAAPALIGLFFGASFAGAAPTARVLIVATAFASSRRILLEGLRGLRYPGAATLAEVAMYPWLLVAAPIALLHFGGEGLAGTLAIGYGFSLVLSLVVALRLCARGDPRPAASLIPGPVAVPEIAQGPSR